MIRDPLASLGCIVFAIAMIGLGGETLVCARDVSQALGPGYNAIPVIPWPPAVPLLGYLFGAILVACGAALLLGRTVRPAAQFVGVYFFLCAMIIILPKYVAAFRDISLRTVVFEPLSIACFAWMLPDSGAPHWLIRASRYILAVALIVFGVDHFLALGFIAGLLPGWIPWHVFWVAFFGVALIASALSIALNILRPWGAAGLGLMFAIWVVTLHLPRVMGLYGIPGAPRSPAEWSSLFIAVAMWGGSWAMIRESSPR